MPTRFTGLSIGTVALAIFGSLTVTQLTQQTTSPSLSDPSVRIVQRAIQITKCSSTGGNVKVSGGAKYDTCIAASPLTTTGSIARISLEVTGSHAAYPIDCGFVKGIASGTGTAFVNMGNVSTGSGLTFLYGTGSLRWNPVDYIKCGTLTTVNSSALDASLRVEYYDDQSE